MKHRLAINPVAHYPRPDATASRKRILSDAELVMIWNAAGEMRKPLATFFRLLILTGQRRIEVAKMQWTELDRDREEWTVPGERAKNGNYHLVPLSAQALALIDDLAGGDEWPRQGPVLTLDGERSLGGFSKARRELDEKIDKALAEKPDASAFEQHWVIHDLRRTMATGLQRMGIRFEVTEAVLNHTGRSKGGIAGVYQLYEWRDEKREALVRWGREIQGIVSPQGGAKVIDLQWRAER
ncbi:MAG: site-specific integrase [Blastomonas sp.]